MRTTKPISTISFNTESYLRLKLDELRKAKRISFWAYINHKPEDDEGGKKAHFHVYVEPSKMLQTDDLCDELREFDPLHSDKPLSCLTWNSSKFDPWYLYALHDKRYLATKGQSRRFHYEHDDIVSSDSDDLLSKARSIDLLGLSPFQDMVDAIDHGLTWEQYFSRGTVPFPQVRNFESAWYALVRSRTYRAGRQGHPMDVDTCTGEVIDNGSEGQKKPSDDVQTFAPVQLSVDDSDLPW